MFRNLARIAVVAVAFALPLPAFAQTAAGSIAGMVRDTSGAVIPGVTVEASSPALIERVRTAQTDAEGRYQIVELRPGTYAMTFALQGFKTVRREGIELTTGFTAAINADMQVGGMSETIVVSGRSPVVDLQNTRQQVVMTREVIENVPTGRSFQNLGVLIPGVSGGQVTGSTINQDVGGGSGQSFMTLSIHGGRFQDQRIDLDGMSTSAWTRPDSSSIVFADGNIEEYNISLSGHSADTETGGVRINLIPRDGGNTFRGSFFANYASPDLQATNNTDALRARGLFDANRLNSMWSVNATFGGPFQRDKLWFYFTYTYSRTDTLVGDSYLNTDPTAWNFVPDKTKQAIDDQVLEGRFDARYLAGLTAQQISRVLFVQQHLSLPLPDRPRQLRDAGQLRGLHPAVHSELRHAAHLVVAGVEQAPARRRLLLHSARPAVQPAAGVGSAADHRQRPECHLSRDFGESRRVHARLRRPRLRVIRHGQPRLQDRLHDDTGSLRSDIASDRRRVVHGAERHSEQRHLLRHAGRQRQSRPSEPRPLRPRSVDDEAADGKRRPAVRHLPQRLPRRERAADAVRSGDALVRRPGGGELAGSEPAVRRILRPVRQRQDGGQGEREPLRAG